jgi:Fe-S cluster assembly iron-binding protein IscA
MIRLSKEAQNYLYRYFEGKGSLPSLRIFPSKRKCSGPPLQLSLDQPKATDLVFPIDRLQFIVDEILINKAKEIQIELIEVDGEKGLSIISPNPLTPPPACGHPCGHSCKG